MMKIAIVIFDKFTNIDLFLMQDLLDALFKETIFEVWK